MVRRRNSDVIVETIRPQGKRIVDVGCGDGTLVRILAEAGASVLGVECSPRQLAKVRPVPGAEIVEGVGQALPVADGSADVVVFFNSLHHIPGPHMATALAEAIRVLKPGGIVYVSEPLPEGAFFEAVRPIDDESEIRALALAALMAAPLEAVQEIRFIHPIRMASYEEFKERIISANAEREDRFARMDAMMRERFASTASRDAEGRFCFDQPMRVNVLRRRD